MTRVEKKMIKMILLPWPLQPFTDQSSDYSDHLYLSTRPQCVILAGYFIVCFCFVVSCLFVFSLILIYLINLLRDTGVSEAANQRSSIIQWYL